MLQSTKMRLNQQTYIKNTFGVHSRLTITTYIFQGKRTITEHKKNRMIIIYNTHESPGLVEYLNKG